jgi:hypothetical protein
MRICKTFQGINDILVMMPQIFHSVGSILSDESNDFVDLVVGVPEWFDVLIKSDMNPLHMIREIVNT